MKTINHETYISLEIAKLLKEAGFDWECINRYVKDTDILVPCLEETNWNDIKWRINDYKSAPTLAVAQKWLREIKMIHIFIYTHAPAKWEPVIMYVKDYTVIKLAPEHSYEEAQETGIKKTLEIILNKQK